jgi:hypothetical protein
MSNIEWNIYRTTTTTKTMKWVCRRLMRRTMNELRQPCSAPCCKELGYTVHDQAGAHFVIQCPFIYMMVHARHSMLESEF